MEIPSPACGGRVRVGGDLNHEPEGWKMTTLGEVVEIKNGKSRPSDGSKYPVYGGNGILGYADECNISEEIIVIGRVGAYCGSIYFEKRSFWLSDNALGVSAKKNSDINFLYYFLKKINLNKQAIGGAQPLLTQGIINRTEIFLPPLPEQRAIAAILSSLDDKIELLREQNKTLEAIAQAIFKEWFVNFKFSVLNHDSSDLMINYEKDNHSPSFNHENHSSRQYSIDNLPEGWRVGKLGEVVDYIVDNRGKTPPLIQKNNDSLPLIEINALVGDSRIIDIRQCTKFVDKSTYDNWFRKGHPETGDVLVSTVGSIGQLAQIFNEKISVAQNIIALRANGFGNYLYQLLRSIQNEIISLDISSVQPSIKVPHLLNVKVIEPTREIKLSFENTITPITNRLYYNSTQIQTLSSLRDTLLPKLMKGEIRVSEP